MNRREFLSAGAAGAFYIAAGGKAWGAAAPSGRIRLCVVGCSRTSFDPKTLRHTFNPKGNRGRGYQVMVGALKVQSLKSKTVTVGAVEATYEVRVDKPDQLLSRLKAIPGLQDATLVAYQGESA